MSEEEERLKGILGAGNLTVTLESQVLYRDYLRRNLDTPCTMTGREGISWEDKYVFGYRDTAEYEALKAKQPSCTDIYELKRFEDLIDEETGILVKVKRVTDNQRFIIDLASLKAVDEQSKNYQLLHDYSVWFMSYRYK